MVKIFLCEEVHHAAYRLLKEKAEIIDSIERISEAHAVISRNLKIDRRFLDRCSSLKVIGIHGTGRDGVDFEAAAKRGVRVIYTPHENADSVAELIAALALNLARKVCLADRKLQAGEHVPKAPGSLTGMELRGKTLGLIGTGDIAVRTAEIFRMAFSMKIIGSSPSLTEEKARGLGMERASDLAEIFRKADIISVSVPLTEKTRNMIGRRELEEAGPETLLINTSRGGIVDETALYAALVSGKLGGAACDVFASEPPTRENPLVGLDNFIATPHIGASTDEALFRVGCSVAEQIFDVLEGREPAHECFGTSG